MYPNFRWSFLWTMKVPPKIKVLIWKLYKNILPTKVFLCNRIPINNISTVCTACNSADETAHHIFNSCTKAQTTWNFVDRWWKAIDINLGATDWLWRIFNVAKGTQYMSQWQTTVLAVLWTLWLCRNERTFNNVNMTNKQIETLIIKRSFVWCNSGGTLFCSSANYWNVNPILAIKNVKADFLYNISINWDYVGFIDGSWSSLNNHHIAGIGGYVNHRKYELYFIFSGPVISSSPLETETKALLFLIQHLTNINNNSNRIIIHTDSMELWTNILNYKSGKSASIKFASHSDLNLLGQVHVAHINRTLNTGAKVQPLHSSTSSVNASLPTVHTVHSTHTPYLWLEPLLTSAFLIFYPLWFYASIFTLPYASYYFLPLYIPPRILPLLSTTYTHSLLNIHSLSLFMAYYSWKAPLRNQFKINVHVKHTSRQFNGNTNGVGIKGLTGMMRGLSTLETQLWAIHLGLNQHYAISGLL